MPSIKKNFNKLMRNLSSPGPGLENSHGEHNSRHHHNRRSDCVRRTICSESVQHYENKSSVNGNLNGNGVDEEEEESGSFIQKYLNGEIHRIHPQVLFDRTGTSLPVHVLGPLDRKVRVCTTGPSDGITHIPYLGSRRIYDKSSTENYYAAFAPDMEERLRHMPAMLRAAYFAKSGQQCYLPREAFQNLLVPGKKGSAANRLPKEEAPPNNSADRNLPAATLSNIDSLSAAVSKSSSCVSITHVGTAPRARIEELMEEDVIYEEDASQLLAEEDISGNNNVVNGNPTDQAHVVIDSVTKDAQITILVDDTFAGLSDASRPTADPVSDEASGPSQEHSGDEMSESFAEVLPVPVPRRTNVLPLPLTQRRRRSTSTSKSKTRSSFRSIHHQLLEDFPFCLEFPLPWNADGHCRAFGMSTTLYERHPQTLETAGNPIADVFAVCARENNAVLAIADGVNWGEKAKVAAQCAVRGAVDFIQAVLFEDGRTFRTTKELFAVLLDSMHAAHNLVLQEHGALATLCVAVVCPLQEVRRYVVCVCNVGDSFAYVYSRKFGVREITKGSHNVNSMRDMRDALGALGPVDGCTPELSNITCSVTVVEAEDIVFLTTDGISDNFDPVIGKFCVIENEPSLMKQIMKENVGMNGSTNGIRHKSQKGGRIDEDNIGVSLSLPKVSAHQRHDLALLRMEDLIRNGITIGDKPCTNARDLCQCFVNFVVQLSSAKRHILEDPDLYPPAESDEKQSRAQQRHHRRKACERLALMPGKLDHATLVAYQVGEWINEEPSIDDGAQISDAQPSNHISSSLPFLSSSPWDEEWTMVDNLWLPTSHSAEQAEPQSGKKERKLNHHFRSIDSPDVERRSFCVSSDSLSLTEKDAKDDTDVPAVVNQILPNGSC